MTFRLGHANVEEPDTPHDEAITIAEVRAHADVVTLNECNEHTTHALLRHMEGWNSFIPRQNGAAENCIIWRPEVLKWLRSGASVVMTGGIHDGLRRGPSRGVAWVLFEEIATGKKIIVATHHSIAKWETSAKWRRALALKGFREVARTLSWVMVRHPHASLILTGDFNVIHKIAFAFVGLNLREVKTPGTFGRSRYDRILTAGKVAVSQVHAFRTKSDHKALRSVVTLDEAA